MFTPFSLITSPTGSCVVSPVTFRETGVIRLNLPKRCFRIDVINSARMIHTTVSARVVSEIGTDRDSILFVLEKLEG